MNAESLTPEKALEILAEEASDCPCARCQAIRMAAEALRATQRGACRRCGGKMSPGQAIAPTYTGMPDFPGDHYAVTISANGPGRLVDCLKCEACGWSVTTGDVAEKDAP